MTHSAIDFLVAYGWTARDARVGIRAKGHCEYCDKDLLASGSAFFEWQTDHIVPLDAGGSDEDDNLAVACWPCNMRLKGTWDPRSSCRDNATRSELISVIRSHCKGKLDQKDREVALVKEVILGLRSIQK